MIRSELDTYAWNVICTIQDLIREERLTYEIDRPIDSTSADFPRELPKPISHQAFNRIIAAFVQHVYGQGLRLPLVRFGPGSPCRSYRASHALRQNPVYRGL